MNACSRYPDDEVVLRYVTGDLGEPELPAFEDHVFACDACLARVEHFQAAQQALTGRVLPAIPMAVRSAGGDHASSGARSLPWRMLSGIAATLFLVLGGWSVWRGTPEPDGSQAPAAAQTALALPAPTTPAAGPSSMALRVAVLAMVTPPPYLAITTRSVASDNRFDEGMQAYVQADWAVASRLLADIATPEARFYQGIADLMRGQAPDAIAALEAARASGQQPYARESVFYLGKAALQRGDVTAARIALLAARASGAGPAGEADRLLALLAELGSTS
jgi:hypothetical protein